MMGCANDEYRFERIDGPQVTTLPFKFDGIRGVRDGASVNAEVRLIKIATNWNAALFFGDPRNLEVKDSL